ncbi:MAG: glycosyltransferase family 4 protein [Streptomyces sp.]|nr:glycosyltransferase family 4 protein [Streptomyces sp.]
MERPLLLAVGRLVLDRGFGPLLDAARVWRALDPQPLLAVAGEGPDRAALQRRIDGEGLPVRLLGRRDDVPALLAAADVAVLSSRWEARSLLAQEALHAGVPLVATAVGGVPELVGEAAELVPYGVPEDLAGAVIRLLADPVRRVELAAAGRSRTAGWPTEDDTVAHVLSVYDELVQT